MSMYVCGPTVYNHPHIGNARPAVLFDLLYRLLSSLYPKVLYARNVTDIDDKIINKAEEEGRSTTEIAKHYYKIYQEDMRSLAVLPPTMEPWATKHIKDVLEIIQKLIRDGYAYEAKKHVLFHVLAFAKYGSLSHRRPEDMIAGARVEVAPYKKDPSDFVLWKPSSKGEPGWESPWGQGRPGWHIECSAMIAAHFKGGLDIHGGGQDLIFPHHENEIAQTVCAHKEKACARFWVHNAFVRTNQEKMSKSLKNVFLVHDILKESPGESVRLALLSVHYRAPLDWNVDVLKQANSTLDRFYECIQKALEPKEREEYKKKNSYKNQIPAKFMEALKDDLNTSAALACMHNLRSRANAAKTKTSQKRYARQLLACGGLFGILQEEPEDWFQRGKVSQSSLPSGEIEDLLAQREGARTQGDYAKADRIREKLSKEGIILKDSPQGTKWQRGSSL